MAGCILVDFEKLQVINRSPAYKNQYVHRRDSVSVQSLTDTEIQKRMRLGLVTNISPPESDGEYDDEQWQDLEDESVEDNQVDYRLSMNRRSSIDLNSTVSHDVDATMNTSNSSFTLTSMENIEVDIAGSSSPECTKTRSRKPRVTSIHEEMEGFNTDDMEDIEEVDNAAI